MSASARYDHPFDRTLIDVPNFRPDELLTMEAEVDDEGLCAVFKVRTSGRGLFKFEVPDATMGMFGAEIRRAEFVMNRRQQMGLDQGISGLFEIAEAAVRPPWQRVVLDRKTGDLLVLHQYFDRPPTSHRLSQADLVELNIQCQIAKDGAH